MFTQTHAIEIAKKLGCAMRQGKAHTYADLYEQGKLVASFGIRRASREKGHGHIPKALHLTQADSWKLHDCTMTKEEYIQVLREKDLLPPESSPHTGL